MSFILDTNVISEMRKAGDGKADPHVMAWLNRSDADDFFVSSITVMELELGVLRLERRDRTQAAMLRAWMDRRVLPEFAQRILSVDRAVALQCARFHVPVMRTDRDVFIAATAFVHGMIVVTRNVTHFEGMVEVVNPWTA